MAKIKFLSEISCKLYIDTGFFDVIESHAIKIIELPAGSYLIEAIDDDGLTLYDNVLDISDSQSQIFVRLSSDVSLLLNTLAKLKNDPNVKFFNDRLKFEHNGKYGYVNNRYEVVIQPEYSYAEDFLFEKTIVKKAFLDTEKVTIIDKSGSVCLDGWFNLVGEDDTTILLSRNSLLVVVSKSDYSIIIKYFTTSALNFEELIPASKICGIDELFGYLDKSGKEVIPFIYDVAHEFNASGYAKVMRFGVERAVDRKGYLYASYDEALKDGTMAIRNSGGLLDSDDYKEEHYTYSALKLSKEESRIRDFGNNCSENGTWWEHIPVKRDQKWGLEEYDPFEEFEDDEEIEGSKGDTHIPPILYQCDRIIYYTNGYFAYRIGKECKLLSIDNPDDVHSYDCDYIFPVILWTHTHDGQYDKKELSSIIAKRHGKYGLIDINGNILIPFDFDKIEKTDAIDQNISGKIGVIWKNCKCAFVNLTNGKLLSEFLFDKIQTNDHPSNWYLTGSTFLVYKSGKIGCLNLQMKEIVPIVYDAIEFKYEELVNGYHYTMFLHQDKKVGSYEFMKYIPSTIGERSSDLIFMTDTQYDECVFLENKNSVTSYKGLSFLAVRKDDKWGILDATPADATYFPVDDSYWNSEPNYDDLHFKYDSLEALIRDADNEFKERYKKHYRPHMVIDMGSCLIVSTNPDE